MSRVIKERSFTGTKSPEPQPYEAPHRELARKAAREGIVLLKNEGRVLPLKEGSKVALFGAGAGKTMKGGTGSGDVNVVHYVTVEEGLREAGFTITTQDWLV